MWRNWAGDQRCDPVAIERPAGREGVVALLERAEQAGHTVRVFGAGHSFSDVALTDGVMVDLRGMDRVLDVDRSSGLVRVEAGITLNALNGRLAEHGLAFENLGDIDVQSVAGAVSTATHGTGVKLRNVSSQVAALELVLADGSVLECSAENDLETYLAARVSVGSLGLITAVTLKCVPAFTLEGIDAAKPLEETLERLDELVDGNEHFEFFTFPHSDLALTRTNNRTDDPPKPPGRAAEYLDEVVFTNHVFNLLCRAGRRFPSQIPRINRLVSKVAGSRRRVDRSDRIFATKRLVRFTEMEYSLPRANAAAAVRTVREIIDRERFAVNFPIEVRFVAPDDAFLSTAHGEERCFIAVHMFKDMRWEPYFAAVEREMYDLGGRPHWGKRHTQTAESLRPRYPEWDRFQAVRSRLDPEGRFSNDYCRRVLGQVGAPVASPG